MREAGQPVARSGRSALVRGGVTLVTLTAGLFMYVACGLDSVATGVDPSALDPAEGGPSSSGGDPVVQGACTPERTVCGEACTDLKADPANCAACGKACGDGQTCSDGACTVLCAAETVRCGETCVDLASDPLHCGGCGKACAPGLLCSRGQCATDCGAFETCPLPGVVTDAGTLAVYCANTAIDRKNCGACGKACKPNEVCAAGACTAACAEGAAVGDVFAANMIGCATRVAFRDRARACSKGATVCSAQDWITRRGANKPTYNYWTNDDLRWAGTDGACTAGPNGNSCGAGTPMRVCAAKTDPVGNLCNYTNCGYGTAAQPSLYFGGCQNNPTAGTLCCTP